MNEDNKPVLKLSNADGNVFMIIGLVKRAAQKAKWDQEKISSLVSEMMAGDYDNVLQLCMKNFEVE